ncbi:uncharacterized protein ARMOST_04779 [Armillaria ostoyae]|uniref:Uncharacterized protein n=1 Tax=Armillaria ostoyae TaxID=47428 RepID=A0A284QY92_ARMOS|nr:uncharacterized protein ARMOST_04779 [Armillaria ostoyae]
MPAESMSFEARDAMKRRRKSGNSSGGIQSVRVPPAFRYGFSLTFQQLIDSALQHHIVEVPENPENDDPKDIRVGGIIIFPSYHVTHQRLCRMPLLTYVNPISPDCDVVIMMYSNDTQADQELRNENHAEVLPLVILIFQMNRFSPA